jgi:uncharacterized protein DUF2637
MWSSLPSNLRAVLGAALLLGIGVAVAAFALSFFALREAAENPALKFGAGHAWLFPIGVDMALIFFEVLLIGASMVRVHERGRVVPYPRAIPFLLVLVAAASTLYFNATRVPTEVRPIALAVPVASILVTLGLAYLLKMLAAASGVEAIHLAPPSVDPKAIVRSTDVLHADAVRVPVGEMASSDRSEIRQTGQRGRAVGGGEYGATTRAIEAVLGELSSEEWTSLGPEFVVGQVHDRWGLPTTAGYVRKVEREGRAARAALNGQDRS